MNQRDPRFRAVSFECLSVTDSSIAYPATAFAANVPASRRGTN